MTTDLIHTDATGLAELIRTGKASSVEVVQAHLDRIEATNPNINAIVTIADGALDAARAADEELGAGGKVGPLHGVPFTVKDSFDTAGVLTQRGSPMFGGRIPDISMRRGSSLKSEERTNMATATGHSVGTMTHRGPAARGTARPSVRGRHPRVRGSHSGAGPLAVRGPAGLGRGGSQGERGHAAGVHAVLEH